MKEMIKKIMDWILSPRSRKICDAYVLGYVQGVVATKETYENLVDSLNTKVIDIEKINIKNSMEIENLRARLTNLGIDFEERIVQ